MSSRPAPHMVTAGRPGWYGSAPLRLPKQEDSAPRAWRVVHACDQAREVLPVIEGQLTAGIKPYILMPDGVSGPEAMLRTERRSKDRSLLTAWNDVRNWRRSLVEAESGGSGSSSGFDLVHAHSFAAGMAAVRNCPAVVYDVRSFIEERAPSSAYVAQQAAQNDGHETSWLGRSFRVAEQFVLTRAGAVVVHSGAMRAGVLERGVANENVFVVPDPLSLELMESLSRPRFTPVTETHALSEPGCINFFAPDIRLSHGMSAGANAADGVSNLDSNRAANLSPEVLMLLEAFVLLREEVPQARLFLQAAGDAEINALLEKATAMGIAGSVHAVSQRDCSRVFASVDVVIANGSAGTFQSCNLNQKNSPNSAADSSSPQSHSTDGNLPVQIKTTQRMSAPTSSSFEFGTRSYELETALRAMILGRPLLAADCAAHRELSTDGRGLLWFRVGDARDLAIRAASVARNPELCASLANAARTHLVETRSPEAVGRKYNQVYRHAFERRKTGGVSPGTGIRLQPLVACL